jgi:thymidine kinase
MSTFQENMSTTIQPTQQQEGYLELILGPMFSGKTTQIIQIHNNYSYIGKMVVVVNYAEDKRYHDSMLSTHDHKMIPCILSHSIENIWNDKNNTNNANNNYYNDLHNADVILINEGQFFKNLKSVVTDMIENHNKIVYICGLDGDFKREKFGELLDLIPFCDKVTKLTSFCSICRNGKKGLFSCRVSKETEQVVIGSDNYKPLCRQCYLSLS